MPRTQLPQWLLDAASKEAADFVEARPALTSLRPSEYNPETYTVDISANPYIDALVILRHYIKLTSDIYFSEVVGARNVDLFMMTPSVSSPMGPGSDSEAVPIKFGDLQTFLVDSSQFGFEPLLMQGLDKVYCYLPSMRGEDPDERHLNQFFHCEMEIRGTLVELKPLIEGYVRALADTLLALSPIVSLMSKDSESTKEALTKLSSSEDFATRSFDQVFDTLSQLDEKENYVHVTDHGRDIKSLGERYVSENTNAPLPVWIENYDRDRVAFYQKPLPSDPSKVINADLIFPPIIPGGFGGEIVGCGQRQDTPEEMYESLKRQNVSEKPYDWYIHLRTLPNYKTTSGFGLGIERFIAWSLGYGNIRDVILYPRLKNVLTLP